MIIGEQKPLSEIVDMLRERGGSRILVAGCNSCVAVCLAGGEDEVSQLADSLRERSEQEGWGWDVEEVTLTRQCEKKFDQEIHEVVEGVDAVVSLGCGVGAQTLMETYPQIPLVPGIDTSNMGAPEKRGVYKEKCVGCGDCTIHLTGGICTLARCSKGLQNGPCGGAQNGKCEVVPDNDCAWHLVYERLAARGDLDLLREPLPPKDWSKSKSGGSRTIVRKSRRSRG